MFEVVNMEKMTPAFLAIAKNTRRDASLSDIRDDNDAVFRTGKERDDYIVNYFKNIYSIKPDTDTGLQGCIERFLGPEILNIPEVINAKITRVARWPSPRPLCSKVAVENCWGPRKIVGRKGP
jgi:hypothetical protein